MTCFFLFSIPLAYRPRVPPLVQQREGEAKEHRDDVALIGKRTLDFQSVCESLPKDRSLPGTHGV